MRRRQLLRTLGCASTPAVAGCSGALESVTPETETYSNPVFEPIFADPTALRTEDGTYYAYATGDDWYDGEGTRLVPIVRSTDLVRWEYVGEALTERPDWKDEGGIWAPGIARHRGRYLLYYSVSVWGDPNPGIGVAVADSPAGPFEDRGKLFTSEEIGVENSIDPFFYVDEGVPYLFWGSFHGIYGVELAADGLSVAGEPFQIAGDAFEGPFVFERDDRYYLFGSVGSCCEGMTSTYHVTVGRSESLRGPYLDADGTDLMTGAGRLVVEGTETFVGPGHNTVVRDDAGDDWMLYHAYEDPNYFVQSTPRRSLMLDRLVWRDGFPTVEGQAPSAEAPVPSARK
ncbi:family 43 glycosylhydrolase [Halomarina pelagica]|uniref:family 43 glycosylhydrolase n=1 Tax=Halomarina pelagica TaxID=2961599 RepID=UPI0020C4B431|nr:family 43 glycosylhydrolase [Halomarina sp. BND7]